MDTTTAVPPVGPLDPAGPISSGDTTTVAPPAGPLDPVDPISSGDTTTEAGDLCSRFRAAWGSPHAAIYGEVSLWL